MSVRASILWTTVLTIGIGVTVGAAAAQPPPAPVWRTTPTPPPAPRGPELQKAAPDPSMPKLLDERPSLPFVFTDQWTLDPVPEAVEKAQRSDEGYGLLTDEGPLQATTLQECIALALKNNTDLQIRRLAPVNAAAGVRKARAIFDPALFADLTRDRSVQIAQSISAFTSGGASTQFTDNFGGGIGLRKLLLTGGQVSLAWRNNRNKANPSVLNQYDPEYLSTLGLSLNQPLLRDFGWGYSLLRVEIAQNTEQTDYYRYLATIADVIARVEEAYWTLVLAQQSVRVEEQGLALARELQRQNEGKFRVGALPQTAVLEARAEVARREANLLLVQNAVANTRDVLRAIVNAPDITDEALIRIDPADVPTVVPYDINLGRSLKTAIEQRPEIVAARLDVRGIGLQRKIAENQLLPRVNVVGGLGLNGISGTGAAPEPTPFAVPNPIGIGGYGRAIELLPDGRFYNYSVGAVIEVPIDNAQAKADYAQANVGYEQSRLALRRLEEGVTLEIKTAVTDLLTDLKTIDATRIARELEEENVRNQYARYEVGLATTKDLLDYLERLTRAQFREVQALTEYNSDLARMRRVEGTLLTARNVLVERVEPEPAPWWASF